MHQIDKTKEPQHFINWKQHFQVQENKKPEYKDLADDKEEYAKLLRNLLIEQGYICCYCEKRIGNKRSCNIEHFKPRNPDKKKLTQKQCQICEEAQLDYSNMFASCMGDELDSLDHCNHKKDNWFDFEKCVSPASKEIDSLFKYRESGKIYSEKDEGTEMIKHLNLDTYVLREQRKNAFEAMMEVEFDEEELIDDVGYVSDVLKYYGEKHDGKYQEFRSMITYCLEHYYI